MKTFAIFASLALAVAGTAIPAPEAEAPIVHSDFSFADWVDSVVDNPSTAMSPEEALAAFNASSPDLAKRQRFANCQQLTDNPAPIGDAVWCINRLAARGRAGQTCNVDSPARSQCSRGNAQIVTVRSPSWAPRNVNCNAIARTAGLIMDRCTRGDNTVSGQAIIPQDGVAVHINEPSL